MQNIITIDGPSGSGKGTICRRLADQLGWHLLDSGALYRLSAIAAEQAGVAFDQADSIAALALTMDISFGTQASGAESIILNGQEVAAQVRAEATGEKASQVAIHPPVRTALLKVQHDFAKAPGLIADGRDMGTVIFPDAPVKIFLIASAEERAQRRLQQLLDLGLLQPAEAGDTLRALTEDIAARDARDAQRAISPMKPADDAITLDSTGVPIDKVEAQAWSIIADKMPQWVPKSVTL